MIVYEKNNKLNINFDNEVNENPDLQISKEDGKTQVLIDAKNQVNPLPIPVLPKDVGKTIVVNEDGSYELVDNNPLIVTFSGLSALNTATCDKTWAEIQAAIVTGRNIRLRYATGIFGILDLIYGERQGSINGYFYYNLNPTDTDSLYVSISCAIDSDNNIVIDIHTNID